MTTTEHTTQSSNSHTESDPHGGRGLRRLVAAIAALAIALSTLVGLTGTASAAASATVVNPVTDNYKARWNADPTVPDLRTWLALDGVVVGGVTFKPAVIPTSTTTYSATTGVALKGSDGSVAVLTAATTSTNVFHQGYFRVDATGTFGLLQQLRTKVVNGAPVNETFTLSRSGVTLGSFSAAFTYDAAVAGAATTSIEFNGPGGRWYVNGTRTRLDWEAPVVTPAPTAAAFDVAVAAPAATTPGSTPAVAFTVMNSGGTAGRAYTMQSLSQSMASPSARLVSTVPALGSCTSNGRCDLGILAPGQKVTVTMTVDVLRTNGYSLSLTAGTVLDEIGDEATVSPAISGKSCTVIGTNAADTLVGTSGADVLCGFAGNDTIRPAAGDDVISGGSGTDTISYTGQATGAVVNLTQKSAWDIGTAKNIGWDTFTGIESAVGTNSADSLLGDAAVNNLQGLGGADQIWGYDSNDTISGGAGADKLYGGNGNDTFDGGADSDLCQQNAGTGTKTLCEVA